MSPEFRTVRFAFKSAARRKPLVALAAVIVGLGVGANMAVFSAFRASLISSLPYAHADRLVTLWKLYPSGRRASLDLAQYRAIRDRTEVYETLTACDSDLGVLRGSAGAQQGTINRVLPVVSRMLKKRILHGKW